MSVYGMSVLEVFSVIEGVVAIALNTGIIIINVNSIKNGLKLIPSELIHLTMGVANITMQSLLLAELRISYLWVDLVLLPFLMFFTSWLSAWLCAYYCATITNFSHRLFVWTEEGHSENGTLSSSTVTGVVCSSLLYMILLNCLGFCFPFLVILISLMITSSSLIRHIWNIKNKNSGITPPKLQAHTNAIRTIALFLILSGVYYIAEVIIFTGNSNSTVSLKYFSWCMIMIFPTAEAIVITQGSARFRKVFLGMVCAK
ncbi:taste receptor type 2 member 1-like [Pseudophryne corroboree]|uniref:taste receptor type 2 member 1-like n=1 Tax=Pseudophryne corroboree TaxID=495146 RepID=UPI0030819BDD